MADVTKATVTSDTSSNDSTNINLNENCKSPDKISDKSGFTSKSNTEVSDFKFCSPLPLNPRGSPGSSSHHNFNVPRNHFSLCSSTLSSAKPPETSTGSKPILLRPSQLFSNFSDNTSKCTNSFILSPPKLQSVSNPFKKPSIDEDELKTESQSKESETNPVVPANSSNNSLANSVGSSISETAVSSSTPVRTGPVSFLPLGTTGSSAPSNPVGQTSGAAVSGFVFGQNLHERVEVPVATEVQREEGEQHEATANDASACDQAIARTNGATSEMLFTSVLQRELPEKTSDSSSEEKEKKSLSEAAREYEESRAVKRKYEEVTVVTGEEEELNVLQMNCKLFAFDNASSTWMERGRGTLRVNDFFDGNKTQSRVIMRTAGSLRVVLNTKIWADMSVNRPSEKSVRLTAIDTSGQIKVFLVMAGAKEIDQLYKTLEWRVGNQKKQASVAKSDSATMDKD